MSCWRVIFLSLFVFAGHAKALSISDIDASRHRGELLEVYLTGSDFMNSSTDVFMRNNCWSDTIDVYVSDMTVAGGESPAAKAYSCQIASYGDLERYAGTAYRGRKLLLHKSEFDGDGGSVFSLAKNDESWFLKVSAGYCDQVEKVCSTIERKRADGGVSEFDPESYNPAANRQKYGFVAIYGRDFSSEKDVDAYVNYYLPPVSLRQNIYGLAVTSEMYRALQIDQGLESNVPPSVSRAVVSSILSNSYDVELSWRPFFRNANNIGVNSQINICRSPSGMGGQVAANRYWLGYGVNASSPVPADAAGNSYVPANEYPLSSFPNIYPMMVHELAVKSCLSYANRAGAFAIGHLSLRDIGGGNWKFVAIDGVVPSIDNAKRGFYDYVFESTMQLARTPNSSGGRLFLEQFSRVIRRLDYLPFSSVGVMAPPHADDCPQNFSFVPNNTPNIRPAERFCGRVSRERSGDPLIVYK